jgi:hypothetical protein
MSQQTQQTEQKDQQEDQQQKSAFSTKIVGERDNHKCQCLFPCVDYDGVHHIDGPNDFSHLRNYTICGEKCCLVCHKPISQTSNAGGSCQQNTEEEKCVVIAPPIVSVGERGDKCQCTFPVLEYDGVHHMDSPNDFSYLHNYTRNGKRCCLVCHKPISQTSNAGGSCQQNTKEEKCVVICPLCDHPCEINGQPCGIHTDDACIYT